MNSSQNSSYDYVQKSKIKHKITSSHKLKKPSTYYEKEESYNEHIDEEDFIKDGKKRAYLFNTVLQSEKTLDLAKLDLKEDLKQRLFDFEFKKMKEYYKNKRFLKMKKSLSN